MDWLKSDVPRFLGADYSKKLARRMVYTIHLLRVSNRVIGPGGWRVRKPFCWDYNAQACDAPEILFPWTSQVCTPNIAGATVCLAWRREERVFFCF